MGLGIACKANLRRMLARLTIDNYAIPVWRKPPTLENLSVNIMLGVIQKEDLVVILSKERDCALILTCRFGQCWIVDWALEILG